MFLCICFFQCNNDQTGVSGTPEFNPRYLTAVAVYKKFINLYAKQVCVCGLERLCKIASANSPHSLI